MQPEFINRINNMEIKAVLTGDIVNSEQVDDNQRALLIRVIRDINNLQEWSPLSMDLFRGDSFQIVLGNPSMALLIATMARAYLLSNTPSNSPIMWDARIAIGIGTVSYNSDSVVTSDGEAYRLSGRRLDSMTKERLAVDTCWEDVNGELNVGIAFIDDLINGWTPVQAQAVYLSVAKKLPQTEIANNLGKSQQAISKILAAAKENLLRLYLNRFETLISTHISQL